MALNLKKKVIAPSRLPKEARNTTGIDANGFTTTDKCFHRNMRFTYRFEELFDETATPPPSAINTVLALNSQERVRTVFVGRTLWQFLTGQCLVNGAGTLGPGMLTAWREVLVDHKTHLAELAQSWHLPPCWKIAAGDWPPALLEIISGHGSDIPAALAWLGKVLAPAVAIAHKSNIARLAALASAGRPRTPSRSRKIEVLHRFEEMNAVALANTTRPNDPYSAPEQAPVILSTSYLTPGAAVTVRLLLAPTLSAALLASVEAAFATAEARGHRKIPLRRHSLRRRHADGRRIPFPLILPTTQTRALSGGQWNPASVHEFRAAIPRQYQIYKGSGMGVIIACIIG
ncbi:hypothetical protein B0H16DRAFT_1452207 [Mycena metata]|uniref:Uncharacterized protein n=1 Tax=Mycena metata TaxID=1033252 RepID=A0AAD7JT81_9AGAR|nr:hypothetical protein B0H16DRAFT_1452207 [Mycena metata]